eukprot:1832755-Rhodomonas_salina.5
MAALVWWESSLIWYCSVTCPQRELNFASDYQGADSREGFPHELLPFVHPEKDELPVGFPVRSFESLTSVLNQGCSLGHPDSTHVGWETLDWVTSES